MAMRDDPERDVFWEICCEDHENDVYSVWSPMKRLAGELTDIAEDNSNWDEIFVDAGDMKLMTGTEVECLEFLLRLAKGDF